jgi:hypothetical protein
MVTVTLCLTAAAALVALLLGVPALIRELPATPAQDPTGPSTEAPPAPREDRIGPPARRGYLAALFALLVGAIATTTVTWTAMSPPLRVGLAALAALAVIVFEVGCVALRVLRERPDGWRDTYRNQIYTSYVLLVAGLVSAALMLSPLSPWTIPFVAIGVLIGGAEIYQVYEARLVSRSPREWRLAHPESPRGRSTRPVLALRRRPAPPPAERESRSTPPDRPAER